MNGPLHTDDRVHNPRQHDETLAFERLVDARLSRRRFLGGLSIGAAVLRLHGGAPVWSRGEMPRQSEFRFDDVALGVTVSDRWPKGYRAQVLLRHGDALLAGAAPYRPGNEDADAQARQFGTNNDFIAYMPLPRGSSNSRHGLLCVNHEYSNSHLLWPGLGTGPYAYRSSREKVSRAQIAVEMAAQGHAVVEIARGGDGRWSAVEGSRRNRRITATTPMHVHGPAAGHELLRTNADPTGTRVLGTFNNCAGGQTPWGTVLIAEENFHKYFWGDAGATAHGDAHARYGVGDDPEYGWGRPQHDGITGPAEDQRRRFDLSVEPNEPFRFGWMVEYDPYDADSVPKKRTALGRMKHEGAGVTVCRTSRVVAYMGDDERFEYLYRYVSSGTLTTDPRANDSLLDDGTLYVARFHDSGVLTWLPLVFGEGPLTAINGFCDQASVLINARRAADLLGATPLDRPEEVEVDPQSGRIYVMLTNNTLRSEPSLDAANPRARNALGHVLELIPPGRDSERHHAATQFRWNVFLLGGEDVLRSDRRANLSVDVAAKNLRCPDNACFDPSARLWIATDGSSRTFAAGTKQEDVAADGLFAIEIDANGNRRARPFYMCPIDAELCGPCFTPDGETLFVSVQHPGESSSFDAPSTRWPEQRQSETDGSVTPTAAIQADGPPPRSAVIAITKLRPTDASAEFDPRIGC